MRALLACALAALGAGRAFAGGGAGTSVAPVFKLGAGARPAGMGNTFVSVADDVNASAWNPAGLGRVAQKSVSFMHYQLFESINYEYLAYAQPVGAAGGVGAHLVYVFTNPIPRTVEDAGGSFDPNASGGTFGNSDLKLNVSGAFSPSDWLSLGAGADYFQDKVDKDSADGFMGDAGLMVKPLPKAAFGASLQNVGPAIRGGGRPPAQARAGGHWEPWEGGLAAAEYDYAFDSDRRIWSIGVEQWFMGMAAVRTGYQWGEKKDAGGNRYSAGMGLRLGPAQFDYAFSPLGELGGTHRVSLTFSFGAPREALDRDLPPPKAIAERPASVVLGAADHLRQAGELIGANRLDEARDELAAAARLSAEDDPLWVSIEERRGQVGLLENDVEGARKSFVKALSLAKQLGFKGPAVGDAYAGVGACLVRQGKTAQGVKFYKRALDEAPSPRTRAAVLLELERIQREK